MEDRDQDIANLEVSIALLRREERKLFKVLADDSLSQSDRLKTRAELHNVMAELLAVSAKIKKKLEREQ